MPLNIAIVGCGLIGRKRAASLAGGRLAICCDVDGGRAQALAAAHPGAETATDWRAVAASPDVDVVIVATTHDMLAPIAAAAAGAGKHVLIEKPGARRAAELDAVAEAAARTGALVRIGFNHRYHRAFQRRARSSIPARPVRCCSSAAATATAAVPVTSASGAPIRLSRRR
jgi:predicted dehydrogenase